MLLFIVCIKDRAIDAFGRPAFVPAIGAAIRSFTDEINRADSEMHRHADDYDLYSVGTFDDSDAAFATAVPNLICRGKDVLSTST